MPKVMNEHSCLIVPSKWEPWGIVVLEAIAAGMKVVVSNRVGSRYDLPVNHIFKSGDVNNLSRVMLAIERESLSDNEGSRESGSENVINGYDVRNWAGRVMRICKDVIGKV